jgi:hypothetical protein
MWLVFSFACYNGSFLLCYSTSCTAGWSPVLFRVMQGITAYLWGSVIFFIILVLCGLHFNHMFIWLDPEVVAHDKLIATKSGYYFPFGLLERLYFFWWMEFIQILFC